MSIKDDLKFKVKDSGEIVASNAKAVYESNLPETLTPEIMQAAADYNKSFHKELTEAATPTLIEKLREGEQTSGRLAELEASIYGVKFSVVLETADEKLTMRGSASYNIGSHMMVAMNRANKLWSNK